MVSKTWTDEVSELFAFGIEQTIIGTTEAIGLQGSLQNVRLKQDGEAGKGALLNRGGGQRTQRRPDVLLGFWSHLDPLAAQNRTDPFGRPAAFGNVVDCGKRLERNEFRALSSERATEIVPIAAHGDCGCPDRTAEAPSRHGWYRYRRDGLCPTPCIRVFENTVVVDALGGRRLRNLTVRGSDGKTQNVAADVLAISGGWNQAMGIGCNLGSRPVWSDEIHAFLLASSACRHDADGLGCGTFLSRGGIGGWSPRRYGGGGRFRFFPVGRDYSTVRRRCNRKHAALACRRRQKKVFVDFQHDVTDTDIDGSGTLSIAELLPNRSTGVIAMKATVHNQSSELVMEGTQRYLIQKQPAA